MNRCICAMKRIIGLILLALCLLSCVGVKYTNEELQFFIEESLPYFVNLDVNRDPVLVMNKDDQYSLKVKNGTVVTLLETRQDSVLLSLDSLRNIQIAEDILLDASSVLQFIQMCLKNGYYTDLHNNPSDVVQGILYLNISEDAIKLFPIYEDVDYIKVHVSTYQTNALMDKAVQIQKQYLVPNGIEVYIKRHSCQYVETYLYGDSCDYALEIHDGTVFLTQKE